MIVQSKILVDLCSDKVSNCRSLDEIIGTELIIKTNKNKRDLLKCKSYGWLIRKNASHDQRWDFWPSVRIVTPFCRLKTPPPFHEKSDNLKNKNIYISEDKYNNFLTKLEKIGSPTPQYSNITFYSSDFQYGLVIKKITKGCFLDIYFWLIAYIS